MVTHLTTENLETLHSSKIPVLVDCYADWCGPCRMMAPTFEKLAEKYKGKIHFMKLDTQAEEGLAMRFEIRSLPTFVLFKNGKEVDRIIGYHSESEFVSAIEDLL